MNNSHNQDKSKSTSPTYLSHGNPRDARLSSVIITLTEHGATVVPTAKSDIEGQVLYVNHVPVLVRTSHTANDCVGIELFHESLRNQWVKSWGLTSQAVWLLHVDDLEHHYWYNLSTLRIHVADSISAGTLVLRNNSTHTRQRNGVSANVMTVWVNKNDHADYLYDINTNTYKRFLQDCVRGEYDE
jgi:hypothetical protein